MTTDAHGRWVWTGEPDVAPVNRFTWFRATFDLAELPGNGTMLFAADSTARLWLNGAILRRKVTRFHEPEVRAESVTASGDLRVGENTILVLHHSWGPITTFQRTAARHAGLYVAASWLPRDLRWQWQVAEEFEQHPDQFLGVLDRTPRIRFPIRWHPRPGRPQDIVTDSTGWRDAVDVSPTARPWPAHPTVVETPGQRESLQRAGHVLAAGRARHDCPLATASLTAATLHPNLSTTQAFSGLVDGRSATLTIGAGTCMYVTLDLHRPVHGYPFLDLSTDAPVVMRLGYGEIAESMYDGATHVRPDGWVNVDGVVGDDYSDLIVLAAGRFTGEIPDERTARWLTVHLEATSESTVTFHDIGIVKSQYPIVRRGSFACGDERLEQAVTLATIHAEVTMCDAYVDTPGREDGQWIEDARPRALVAERWFGDTSLRDLMVRTLAEGQGSDGNLHPFFPSNFPAYPAHIDWSVQWVAMLWDIYRWTGSPEIIERYWPQLQRYWELILRDVGDDGIWRSQRVFADIRNSDVGGPRSSSSIITPWLIDRLRWSAELAVASGRQSQARSWLTVVEAMVQAFRRDHVVRTDPRAPALIFDVLDPDWEGDLTPGQAAQVVPVLDGLLTDDEADAVLDFAFPEPNASPPPGVRRWNNPTWLYRVLSALSARGRSRRAVAHLVERFAPYLPQHPRNVTPLELQGPYGGPLPEYWVSREDLDLADGEINDRQPVDPTGSHGWAAVMLLWLHESLLGVRVIEPGGARITIAPDDAGLPYVTGTTITPRGPVFVHWDPQGLVLEVDVPAGTTADVRMPEPLGTLLEFTNVHIEGPARRTFAAG